MHPLLEPLKQVAQTRESYLIATALRGPDVDPNSSAAFTAKYMTAGVIRHLLGVPEVGLVVSPEQAKDRWLGLDRHKKRAVRKYFNRHWHFWRHQRDGLTMLVTLGVQGAMPYFEWLLNEMYSSSR